LIPAPKCQRGQTEFLDFFAQEETDLDIQSGRFPRFDDEAEGTGYRRAVEQCKELLVVIAIIAILAPPVLNPDFPINHVPGCLRQLLVEACAYVKVGPNEAFHCRPWSYLATMTLMSLIAWSR
jgi:hypothetical protein